MPPFALDFFAGRSAYSPYGPTAAAGFSKS